MISSKLKPFNPLSEKNPNLFVFALWHVCAAEGGWFFKKEGVKYRKAQPEPVCVAVDELRSLVDTQTYLNLLRSLTALKRQADSHTVSVNRIIFTVWWTPSTWMNGVGVGLRKAHRIYRNFCIIFPICIRGALVVKLRASKHQLPRFGGPPAENRNVTDGKCRKSSV